MIGLFPAGCWAGWFSNQDEQRSLVLHLLVRVSWATVSDPSRSVIVKKIQIQIQIQIQIHDADVDAKPDANADADTEQMSR